VFAATSVAENRLTAELKSSALLGVNRLASNWQKKTSEVDLAQLGGLEPPFAAAETGKTAQALYEPQLLSYYLSFEFVTLLECCCAANCLGYFSVSLAPFDVCRTRRRC
jgi:hypothetical protein